MRYLINDVAVKLNKPWVYGGCVGSHGQTMTILPGQTPCLRCVFEASPGPGEVGTCETAGVLSPIVNIIASLQAAEAFKILVGQLRRDQSGTDLYRRLGECAEEDRIAPLLGKVDCPCCQHRKFEWLEGAQGSQTTSLCGRNAVQVSHRMPGKLNFEEMARQLTIAWECASQSLSAEVQCGGA